MVAAALAAVALALGAPPAYGVFDLMKIREVYPGSALNPGSEFVELQMHAPGQNQVQGHPVRLYDAMGNVTASATFATPVPNSQNQRSILVATTAAQTQFGVAADLLLPMAGLTPSGGAACFDTVDCVSWGNFSGDLPSAAGTPATAIPDGSSLERSIAAGCSSLLEGADDTNESATDFAPASPSPRNNAAAPSENACPETRITKGPSRKTTDRTPTFKFTSSKPGSTFDCKVDRSSFKSCSSPNTLERLSLGRHAFRVRARDADGALDPSPARRSFKVKRK